MTSIYTERLGGKVFSLEGEAGKVWDVRLFQLVSLFDMLEFDVFHFVRHSDTLQKLQREIEQREEEALNPQERQQCLAVMNQIRSFLAGFQIDVGRCFERIDIKYATQKRQSLNYQR